MAITKLDRLRLGVLWGMSLAQQDLDRYALYFFLALTDIGCDFYAPYAWFFTVQSIVVPFFQPACGWFTDFTTSAQHWTLIGSAGLQLLCFALQIYLTAAWRPFRGDIDTASNGDATGTIFYAVLVIWLVRWLGITQSQMSCWKVVKLRLAKLYPSSGDGFPSTDNEAVRLNEMNVVISSIGNLGDISSCLFEMTLLCSTILLPKLLPNWYTDDFMKDCILFGSLLANVLVLLLSLTITASQLLTEPPPPPKSQATAGSESLLPISETAALLQPINDAALSDATKGRRNRLLLLWDVLWTRLLYLYRAKLVLHPLVMCVIVTVFYYLIEYPLTLNESAVLSTDTSDKVVCDGLLRNLMNQGGILNVTFMFGSLCYLAVLVRLRPASFFRWMYPLLSVLLAGCICVLWLPNLPDLATFLIISFAQVIPYYLSMYLFFVLTSSADPSFYGFVYSIYGLTEYLVSFVPAIFLQLRDNFIIFVCLGLVVVNMAYSVGFSRRHRGLLKEAALEESAEF